ncbi:MAG: lipid A biosynthesis lauroyl acyltransferase HtrB [Rhodobacteraceae bacterium HLUCCA08]|nr:MAG: lipid A biosynthesis lauroyl acyltransferase HtrB [Rhodobacteraceae bacterium HLUCCA08]
MSTTADRTGTIGDRLINWALRGLIGLALVMPYRFRVPLFGRLVAGLIAPLAGYRARAQRQLAHVWPDMDPAERARIARACCDNFGRTMIENYSRRGFRARIGQTPITGDGLAALDEARAAGRPVLFLTGHFGNFEAPRQALANRGHVIGGLYRPMANPYFNAHYARTMETMSGPVFAQGRRGMAGFVRMLKGGGMGTLLFDVRATAFPEIDFLGQPAPTATSAAEIALKLDAVLIPYFGTRAANGLDFEIALEAPIPHTDPATMTREATRRLEARVRAHPEQWFWVHRRWSKSV